MATGAPIAPDRRTVRRRRYFHGGALSMAVMASTLALVAALVATIVYAQVDAGRQISSEPTTVPKGVSSPSPTTDDRPTTTKVEILSPEELAKKLDTSVRTLHTLDEAGQPVDASAFVVGSFGGQTLLLTSFAVVRAATREPAPPITLDQGQTATLWTWQEDRDLGVLVIGGGVESLPWAQAAAKKGDKIFTGGAGQKLSVGIVTGTSDGAIEHNIFIEPARQGSPIVNQKGEVVAMASLAYDPSGKATDTTFVGVPIRAACEKVIRCGGGNTVPGESTTTAVTVTTTTP